MREYYFLKHTTMSQDGETCWTPKSCFPTYPEAWFQATALGGSVGFLRIADCQSVCSQRTQQKQTRATQQPTAVTK